MQISKQHIEVIKQFNRNIDWLKRKHLSDSILEVSQAITSVKQEDWLSVREATQFINRSRSWIARITVVSASEVSDTSMLLVKGLDWKRETNRIYYKRSSLENLKKDMEKAGEAYDSRLSRNEVVL